MNILTQVSKSARASQLLWIRLLVAMLLLSLGLKNALAAPGTEIAVRLFEELSKTSGSKSFVFSPYAVRVGLGMAALGARGQTKLQLGKQPEPWSSPGQPNYKFFVASRLWVDRRFPLTEGFLKASEESLGFRPWMVDWLNGPDIAFDRINLWGRENSQGRIRRTVSPEGEAHLPSDPRMIASTALYFKGNWGAPWVVRQAEWIDGRSIPFLERRAQLPHYQHGSVFQMVEVPMADEEIGLLLVVPQPHSDLAQIEREMNPDAIEDWINRLTHKEVQVGLPKFVMEYEADLREALMKVGVVAPFSRGAADFSGMRDQADLSLDGFFHHAGFSISETALEADSTSLDVRRVSRALAGSRSQPGVSAVMADRPFMFVLRHRRTNSILFMGKLQSPSLSLSRELARPVASEAQRN